MSATVVRLDSYRIIRLFLQRQKPGKTRFGNSPVRKIEAFVKRKQSQAEISQ
jgi:hypothetical protein